MSLSVKTVADSIAGLSIGSIDVRDLDEIIENVGERNCPILFPEPRNFLSNIRLNRDATGSSITGIWTVEYHLSYKYLHAPIGSSRSILELYPDMVENVCSIVDKILVSDALTGAIDLKLDNISDFGAVADPAGNTFHGCEMVFNVMEYE